MKKHLQDSLVIGFALFSMFFGAGNVIFPPYLGLELSGAASQKIGRADPLGKKVGSDPR